MIHIELIQVCAAAGEPQTAEGGLRSLNEAGQLFPGARKRLITLTADGLPHSHPADINALPAHRWLLQVPESS